MDPPDGDIAAATVSVPAYGAPVVTVATPPGLARRADASVFGLGEPGPAQIEAYWRDVDAAAVSMRTSSPWWRRVTAPFALTSLRAWR